MSQQLPTKEDMYALAPNLKSWDLFINGSDSETVSTRLGAEYPTLQKSLKMLFVNHGYIDNPKPTLADLQADTVLQAGDFAIVTQDVLENNGVYEKVNGEWVKVEFEVLSEYQSQLDQLSKAFGYWGDDAFVAGDYIRADGTEAYQDNYGMTGFIPVAPDTLYDFSAKTSPTAGGLWYDEDKNIISSFGTGMTVQGDGTIPAVFTERSPTNAKFVRMTSYVEYGSTGIEILGKYVRPLENFTHLKSSNNVEFDTPFFRQKLTSDDFTYVDKYVDKSDGQLTAYQEYVATDYHAIVPNSDYITNLYVASNNAIAWYGSDFNFIDFAQGTDLNYTVTAPSNARYVRLSYKKDVRSDEYFEGLFAEINPDILHNIIAKRLQDKSARAIEVKVRDYGVTDSYESLINDRSTENAAYPVGSKVYDHSLRTEVYADGINWRMPDGSAAMLATRVYDMPDWDEFRDALPTYASRYAKLVDMPASTVNDWTDTSSLKFDRIEFSDLYGNRRLKLTTREGTNFSWMYNSSAAITDLKQNFVFDYYADLDKIKYMSFGLLDASGNALYYINIKARAQGLRNYAQNGESHVRIDFHISDMIPLIDSASFSDVAHVGFRVLANNSKDEFGVYISDIENVDFKPKITLRFDDQELSVYENALPAMQAKDMRGLIAVITGAKELTDSTSDGAYGSIKDRMVKSQLLEFKDAGWDLVSHTHAHLRAREVSDEVLRRDYRLARDYLRNELEVNPLCYSMVAMPFTFYDDRNIAIAREFYDAVHTSTTYDINEAEEYINPQMMRQPMGYRIGGHWSDMRAYGADRTEDIQRLIDFVELVIEKQGWGEIYFHILDENQVGHMSNMHPDLFENFINWLDNNKLRVEVVTPTEVVRRVRPNDERIN